MNKIKLNKEFSSKYVSPFSMKVIALGKKYVANTWIHKLPITELAYRKIFYFGREIGESTIPFKNRLLTVHTKDISMVPALINNNFEEYELEVFESLVKPGSTILDIGANIGVYSLIASDKLGKKGHIYAFEPVPENLELLKKNLTQNNIANVTVINKAVGNFDGEIKMEVEKDSIATHHVSTNPKNPVSVQVTTIDSFINTQGIKQVSLIKMDIEGYEGFAIEGATQTLKLKSTQLLTEFSADFIKRSGKDPMAVGRSLFQLFKYCYFVDEKHKKLTLVKETEELIDYRKTNFLFRHSPI